MVCLLAEKNHSRCIPAALQTHGPQPGKKINLVVNEATRNSGSRNTLLTQEPVCTAPTATNTLGSFYAHVTPRRVPRGPHPRLLRLLHLLPACDRGSRRERSPSPPSPPCGRPPSTTWLWDRAPPEGQVGAGWTARAAQRPPSTIGHPATQAQAAARGQDPAQHPAQPVSSALSTPSSPIRPGGTARSRAGPHLRTAWGFCHREPKVTL